MVGHNSLHGSGRAALPHPALASGEGGASALFAYSVGTAGDVNGDGYADVIVGAYFLDNGQANEGRAFGYHGSASGLSLTANWTAESDQPDAAFGFSAGTAGDVNYTADCVDAGSLRRDPRPREVTHAPGYGDNSEQDSGLRRRGVPVLAPYVSLTPTTVTAKSAGDATENQHNKGRSMVCAKLYESVCFSSCLSA